MNVLLDLLDLHPLYFRSISLLSPDIIDSRRFFLPTAQEAVDSISITMESNRSYMCTWYITSITWMYVSKSPSNPTFL